MSILSVRDGYTSERNYFVCDLQTCSLVRPAEHNGTKDQQGQPNNIIPKGWCVPNDAKLAPISQVRPIYCCIEHWLEDTGRPVEAAAGAKLKASDISIATEVPSLELATR